MLAFIRTSLIARILCVTAAVILCITAGNIAIQRANTGSAVQGTISSYNMSIAGSYASQLNTGRYSDFLADPQETELYWSLRNELDQFRESIGARYVYFVRIDEAGQPLLMIDGRPEGDPLASPINEQTDMPASAVEAVQAGENASSELIKNPEYGDYISAFVPVKNDQGELIGALGIDTDVSVLSTLTGDVLLQSLPLYGIILAVSLTALAVLAWFVTRSLRPLHTITAGAESMAAGDLAEASRILHGRPVTSRDEIGTAYQAMLKMSEELNTRVKGMVFNVSTASDYLYGTSETFSRNADDVLRMSETVNGKIGDIFAGASTQTEGAQSSALAMDEMAQGIARISSSAASVSGSAVEALDKVNVSQTAVSEMNRQMKSIAESTHETLDMATQLQGYAAEIEGALLAIRQFADQTKLLALNASIEAARAGEHGRGFTVVAGEVRKLAEGSSAAVERVADLLTQIGNASSGIGTRMEGASREVTEGVHMSAGAEEALLQASAAFREVAEQIIDVSATAEQLSAGSEEVAAAVGSMAMIAGGVSEQTRQIRELTDLQLEKIREVYDASMVISANTNDMRDAIRQVRV
ncbi:chemotaxis protein [Paenibacillus sp. FSL R7-0273]|uniref:methyl-accepting chemotaxis protein n=1 Tax=Paenibacillus sp. FSL R7-0273 TaxID=1536772 RepID=UPI0004F81630|nr:HAMP domain-containing methyl-accepting chemotaxis protein [Paenibacillus sp. FSL R7-0273]AIQ47221.1 chemotaxis protein [Paenibacillus sp. FSL R7-0273]OMF91541.1 methyl-accepting chemotaxis protein [Paenibacillus sp. FSL R7-0273]